MSVVANPVPSSPIRLEVRASSGILNFVITRATTDPVCPSSVYFSMVQKKYDAYVPHDLCRPVNRQMSVLKERVAKQDCVGVGVKYTFIDNDKRTRIRRMLWSSGTRLLNPF